MKLNMQWTIGSLKFWHNFLKPIGKSRLRLTTPQGVSGYFFIPLASLAHGGVYIARAIMCNTVLTSEREARAVAVTLAAHLLPLCLH